MAAVPEEAGAQNFQRLVSLLVDIGTAALRKLLLQYVLAQSGSLEQHLLNHQTKLEHLKKRHVISVVQMDQLFPQYGTVDIQDFDVTLLSCLLKNICGKLPTNEAETIEDLRNYRNELVGHMPSAVLDWQNFNVLWRDISQTITDIAKYYRDPSFVLEIQRDIKDLWLNPRLKPASDITAVLIQWHRSDQRFVEQMERQHAQFKHELESTKRTTAEEMKKQHAEYRHELDRTKQRTKEEMVKHRETVMHEFNRQTTATRAYVDRKQDELTLQAHKLGKEAKEEAERRHTQSLHELKLAGEATAENVERQVQETKLEVSSKLEKMKLTTHKLQSSVGEVKIQQREMEGELEQVKVHIKEHEERLECLSQQTHSEQDHCTMANPGAIDELKEFLLNHYREKLSSIPISPMFSKRTVPLESLFTELVVVEDIDKGLGQMPQRGQKEEREVPVSSYEDIFHKGDKRLKDIYLIAEGGAGKTVSCKQIVNTWVRTHEQQQVVGCLNHNETVMKRFKYLFFVPLREVSGKNDLIDAVCECLTDQASIKTMIRSVFDTSPNEVLVVLDGLDEVKVIPDRHRSHSYTILTTTRPWKFDIVQQSDHLEVDRLLKLKGLDDERIPELIDKVLENCYDDTTKVARKNIQTNIESHGLMTSARIPLVLVSLIHMCHEQKSLSPSQTRTMQDIIDCIIECNEKKIQSGDLYPAPEQVAQPLKGIKDEECSLLKYRGVIMALSKLAFYALINDNKENSLVFSKKTLRKYFSSDSDLQLCLTLGLLSKTEQLGYLKKNVEISFPHKVFQEWFAALCVVDDTEAFTKLKQYLMSTETILDMSNVFAFVCGMCGESGSELTKRVMEICTSSPDIQHFRTTVISDSSIVERLTDMYIRCAIECETTGQVDTTVLYISDIWVSLRKATVNNDMYCRAVSYLIDTNASRLTAVSLYNLTSPRQSVPQVIREALCNHTFNSLQKLHVQDVDVAVVNSMLTNNPGIQVLAVWYLGQSSVGLCLPLLQQLQHLELWRFPVTRYFLQQLSALGQLRSLRLRYTDIGDHYLDLSSLTHLTTLTLYNITMTSSVWQGMLQTINTLQSLQMLELEFIRLRGDTRSGTTTQMSTWFMSQLQELECTYISPQVCLPLLAGLHDASSLISLYITSNYVPEEVTMIARAIPHLYQLEKLKLGYIDFRDQQLTLKYNTKLQKLILRRVQMSPTSWHHLFDSLQSLPHLKYIKLYNVKISLDMLDDVRLPKHLVITSHENSVHEAGEIDVECKQI